MMAKTIIACVLCVLIAAPGKAQDARDADAWRTYAGQLKPNAFVKVRLTSGESFRGHVVLVDRDEVRVNPKTRVAVPLRRVAYADIVSIDQQKEPKWNPASKVLLGVGIGWAVLYGVALVAIASLYD